MYKQILGISLILILAGIILVNFVQQNNETQEDDLSEMNSDPPSQGGAIAPDSIGLDPGEAAPEFELETLNGDRIKLSDLEGKKVILNFWATWCGPCRDEMPEMQEFYDEHNDEVEMLAINLTDTETNESDVPEFIDEFGFTYPILMDEDGAVSDEYKGSIAVPTTYFIGTDGVIQAPPRIGPMTYEFMEETINSIN